jgi:hypothetical protein
MKAVSMNSAVAAQQLHAFVILTGYRVQTLSDLLILPLDFEGIATNSVAMRKERIGHRDGWIKSQRGHVRNAVPAIFVLALTLGGCSGVADVPLIGVPSNAPARPDTPGRYLPVHDVPPPRQEEVLSLSDQTRIEQELSEARNKGKATAASDAAEIAASAPPPPPAKQAKKKASNQPK